MAKYNMSKREAKKAGVARVRVNGGGASQPSSFGTLESIQQRGINLAEKTGTAEALPHLLKDEFRKRQDPKLNRAIAQSEQRMLGGAIAGLYKYQDIKNPFQRRALAEKFQGSLSKTFQHFSDEKTRREGKFLDYIEKYTGLFSADVAKERLLLNAEKEMWQTKHDLEREAISDKRYTEERAYDRGRDVISDKRYDEKFEYSKQRDVIEDARREQEKAKTSGDEFERRASELADDVYAGKFSREKAREVLKSEFGKSDKETEIIYNYVPDGYEASPQYYANEATTEQSAYQKSRDRQTVLEEQAMKDLRELKKSGASNKELKKYARRAGVYSLLEEFGL